jgi:hypothetical protein
MASSSEAPMWGQPAAIATPRRGCAAPPIPGK